MITLTQDLEDEGITEVDLDEAENAAIEDWSFIHEMILDQMEQSPDDEQLMHDRLEIGVRVFGAPHTIFDELKDLDESVYKLLTTRHWFTKNVIDRAYENMEERKYQERWGW